MSEISTIFRNLNPSDRPVLISRLIAKVLRDALPDGPSTNAPQPPQTDIFTTTNNPATWLTYDQPDLFGAEYSPSIPTMDLAIDFSHPRPAPFGQHDFTEAVFNHDHEDEGSEHEEEVIKYSLHVLNLTDIIEKIRDICSISMFYDGFSLALRTFPFDSPPGDASYASAARLSLAAELPRGLVLKLGDIIDREEYVEGRDFSDMFLVKEWDYLRHRTYCRQVQTQVDDASDSFTT